MSPVDGTTFTETDKILYRAFVYVDKDTFADFHPRLEFWGYPPTGGTRTLIYTADFGEIAASGHYFVDVEIVNTLGTFVEIVPFYTATSGSAKVHAISVHARFLNVDAVSLHKTVPCRSGLALLTGTQPPGVKFMWALRADGTGCTGFNPVVIATGMVGKPDGYAAYALATFGFITTSGIFLASGLGAGTPFSPSGMELRYICKTGAPVIYGLSLIAVYPESS